MKIRYGNLDMLRGIAIIGVILIHISGTMLVTFVNGSFSEVIAIFVNQASRYAVPVFLFLSGLGLTLSNSLEKGYFLFIRHRITKIILLYFVWNVIYYLFVIGVNSGSFNIIIFIKNFILGSNYYHLYYVPLIILFYLLYPLLLKIGDKKVGVAFILLITIMSQISDKFIEYNLLNNPSNFLNWIFYFVLGIWFARNIQNIISFTKRYQKVITLLFLLTFTVVFVESYISNGHITTSMRPTVILFTIMFILAVFCLEFEKIPLYKYIIMLSKMSYGIYLSHILILDVYVSIYSKLGMKNSIFFLISSFVLVTFISMVLTYMVDKSISMIKNKTSFKGIFKEKSISR
ncbi:acyltransferase [Bacillus timonensis]|nr:acyltransferase [Bacillus timonensis]